MHTSMFSLSPFILPIAFWRWVCITTDPPAHLGAVLGAWLSRIEGHPYSLHPDQTQLCVTNFCTLRSPAKWPTCIASSATEHRANIHGTFMALYWLPGPCGGNSCATLWDFHGTLLERLVFEPQ